MLLVLVVLFVLALVIVLLLVFLLLRDRVLQNMECDTWRFHYVNMKSMSLESCQSLDPHMYASRYSSLLFSHNWELQEICLQGVYSVDAQVWRFNSRASPFAELKRTRGLLAGCMQIFFLQLLTKGGSLSCSSERNKLQDWHSASKNSIQHSGLPFY